VPHGGKRKGAGRKKGSLTSKSREIIERVAQTGLTPLQVMLEAMVHYHNAGNRDRAAAIAKDAAPDVHPRLSAMQVSGGATPLRLELVEEIVVSGALANGDGHDHANGQAAPGAG
jgi:hypothetical protein